MKKGFTLIELVVVLIIVAVLGTLGLTQYTRLIEKARGAEAKGILGNLRKMAAAYYMEKGSIQGIDAAGLGVVDGQNGWRACTPSHYFYYSTMPLYPPQTTINISFRASRCSTGGKEPQGDSAGSITLDSDFSTGVDTWSTTGGY